MSKLAKDYTYLYWEEYVNNRKTLKEIAKEYGTGRKSLSLKFREMGFLLRNNPKFEIIQADFNIFAFDKWSPEMAYWLGFIAADGSIHKDRNSLNIGLQIKDYSHLEKYANFLDLNKKPTIYWVENKQKGIKSEACRITIYSKHITNRLNSIGIVPDKTHLDIDFLSFVPEQYKIHFVIGYFDGDGIISHSYGKLSGIGFIGNYKIIESIILFLKNKLGFSFINIYEQRGVFTCYWYKKVEILKFSEIYVNTFKNNITLERKRLILNKYIQEYKHCKRNTHSIKINSELIKYYCKNCGIETKNRSSNNLCPTCSQIAQRTVERPSKEELLQLILNKPFLQIGKMYGVSDNSIRKWCKFYNLPYKKADIDALKQTL